MSNFQNYPYDDWKPARARIDFVNKFSKGDSLLDIGCGYYPVTKEVKIRNKIGIDISKQAANKSLSEFNEFHLIDPTMVSKEYLLNTLGTFDTIVASEFLEHLENPLNILKKIYTLLNKNGNVILTVPNGRSIATLTDRAKNNGRLNRFKLFHKTHKSLYPVNKWIHLFHISNLKVKHFDFRPSDIIYHFPKEKSKIWKNICKIYPDLMAHQFFFVLCKND